VEASFLRFAAGEHLLPCEASRAAGADKSLIRENRLWPAAGFGRRIRGPAAGGAAFLVGVQQLFGQRQHVRVLARVQDFDPPRRCAGLQQCAFL